MDVRQKSDRWMALAGPAALVVLLLGLALAGSTPGEDSTGKEVIAHYSDGTGAAYASVFMVGPAVALLLIFTSYLRVALGRGIGAPGKLLQYGAIVYCSGLLIGNVFTLGETVSADHKLASSAEALNVLNNESWIPISIGIGVMLLGAGLAVLRTAVLPRWMGMVAVVVGVLSLLGPGGFLGFFLGPVWIAVAGVLLYRRPVDVVAPAAA